MSEQTAAARVGIVGAGQLARMLCQAAIPLGIEVHLLAERADDSAALVTPNVILGAPASPEALAALAARCDVVTFDHELVPLEPLMALRREGRAIRPGPGALRFASDKRHQREVLGRLGFPVPAWAPVATAGDVAAFAGRHGWPVVVKAVRGGYDGRGVWMIEDAPGAEALLQAAGERDLFAEEFVRIDRELAAQVARRPGGEAVAYPVVWTVQQGGVFRRGVTPAPVDPVLAREAQELALGIAEATDTTGMLAVELFVARGRLVVNELATRPHNSGHYSIEGCVTSQFENHLRAVLDWPLGVPQLLAPAVATVNVFGGGEPVDLARALPAALRDAGVHVHLYGKGWRPGRKLGHVTVLDGDGDSALARAERAAAVLSGVHAGAAR